MRAGTCSGSRTRRRRPRLRRPTHRRRTPHHRHPMTTASSRSSPARPSSRRHPGSPNRRTGCRRSPTRPRTRSRTASRSRSGTRPGNREPTPCVVPALTSARLRARTPSISPWSPSAVPQTTAWSGVSSQSRPASSTTCCIERDCSMVFWSVRRYAASIARIIAPDIDTAGIAWATTTTTMPPAMAAAPMAVRPASGILSPATMPMTPPMIARTPRPVQRLTTLLGFSPNQPRSTTCLSSAVSKAATSEPNLGRSSGLMKPSSGRAIALSFVNATFSAGPIGRRAFSRRCASTSGSPAPGETSMPTFLPPRPRKPAIVLAGRR